MSILSKYRQTGCKKESGGLLFSNKLDSNNIFIDMATPPTRQDIRTVNRFKHNKLTSQKLINECFLKGLYYIGDWHSHSQLNPQPSCKDIKTINNIYQSSQHHLNYIIMLIISKDKDFSKSYIGLTDGKKLVQCIPYS
ncbi:Mov34/MPN/PAD-1 family protein [Glaciecola sp. MF2-115]|uniref:Mov34/MPN/PAD-1 family protein n=1 Tax=Glaciecola sp. MF2-115 TaxID=3384827 RepID=UPI0039A2B096